MVPANRLGKVSSIDSGKAKETTMGKIMETNQFAAFMAAVAMALPRDVDATTVQGWIDNPKGLQKTLREALMPEVEQKVMEKSKPTLLTLVDTTAFHLPTKFVVRDNFKKGGAVRFCGFWGDFEQWFLDKVETLSEPIKPNLCYHTLNRGSVDTPIIAELGGEAKAETSLAEVFALLLNQPNGGAGPLLTNGYANIFYVRDVNGVLRAVRVLWYDGVWRVYAFSVGRPGEWDAGDRVFSRGS